MSQQRKKENQGFHDGAREGRENRGVSKILKLKGVEQTLQSDTDSLGLLWSSSQTQPFYNLFCLGFITMR